MPKLWDDTIESHRRAVHDAVLNAASNLIAANGLLSVTMSQIAENAGVGRATLYKYFPDLEAVFMAWHERRVADHLRYLAEERQKANTPGQRLCAVLQAVAEISGEISQTTHGPELHAALHRGPHVLHAQRTLMHFMREVLAESANAGCIRTDVPPEQLAIYCLHALSGARAVRSKSALRQLMKLTLAGLQFREDCGRSARTDGAV